MRIDSISEPEEQDVDIRTSELEPLFFDATNDKMILTPLKEYRFKIRPDLVFILTKRVSKRWYSGFCIYAFPIEMGFGGREILRYKKEERYCVAEYVVEPPDHVIIVDIRVRFQL